MNLQTIDNRDWQTGVNIRMRKMYIPQPLLMKSENFMLMSRGPEYICSCCNQLWYKHSVITAEKLSNPAGEYLLTKTSVDGIEWICQSCDRHMKKEKIPPYAAKNGMSLPAKPNFFYLNELECRMLAPRLAFQKLLPSPRGNQFKVKGNVVNVPANVNNTVNMLLRLQKKVEQSKFS